MEPLFGDGEKKSLIEYMDSGGWLTEFVKTKELEDLITKFTGSRHSILVNNGTISLTLAAMACNIVAGDEVIIPNYTMIATPNAFKLFGAIPVFVDVEPETLCINIEQIEKVISRKTKAIVLVSANGRYPSYGIKKLEDLCKKYKN